MISGMTLSTTVMPTTMRALAQPWYQKVARDEGTVVMRNTKIRAQVMKLLRRKPRRARSTNFETS
ncbi:hypothetical protein B7R22_18560 [Subtercola boreus]|uniref:Uncharacterized protein n=1 Tax=Subtercola boreus TaxID=120213 RepID=A0A3E0VS03_9MICO|nr:hypothetical protein B7R22_18560 [Subtercola boreus]